eukprot:scaffold42639_cov37-Attheya_sp.AAC.9
MSFIYAATPLRMRGGALGAVLSELENVPGQKSGFYPGGGHSIAIVRPSPPSLKGGVAVLMRTRTL